MTEPRVYKCGDHESDDCLHYTQCGLKNIYLASGFKRETVGEKEYVRIRNIDSLWKTIGISIVKDNHALSPAEINFLRRHMKLTQAELAKKLGVDTQTYARWEKEKTELPGPAALAIRTLFLTSPAAQPEGSEIIVKLYEIIQEHESESNPAFSAAGFVRTMNNDDGSWKYAVDTPQMALNGV
ncbi:MAG: helix-turn-helix domain-containing protein [Pseudomonadota bacterium]